MKLILYDIWIVKNLLKAHYKEMQVWSMFIMDLVSLCKGNIDFLLEFSGKPIAEWSSFVQSKIESYQGPLPTPIPNELIEINMITLHAFLDICTKNSSVAEDFLAKITITNISLEMNKCVKNHSSFSRTCAIPAKQYEGAAAVPANQDEGAVAFSSK